MQLLENAILERGRVKDGDVLKVDAFLNHQMDVSLINELGKEFFRRFGDRGVTKILTIEASGIGIACITAQHFGVPVVFAKKTQSRNIDGEVLTSQVTSFTHQRNYDIIVSARFLSPDDRVLLIDDFLAKGSAMLGLISLVRRVQPSSALASASKRASMWAARPFAISASTCSRSLSSRKCATATSYSITIPPQTDLLRSPRGFRFGSPFLCVFFCLWP